MIDSVCEVYMKNVILIFVMLNMMSCASSSVEGSDFNVGVSMKSIGKAILAGVALGIASSYIAKKTSPNSSSRKTNQKVFGGLGFIATSSYLFFDDYNKDRKVFQKNLNQDSIYKSHNKPIFKSMKAQYND